MDSLLSDFDSYSESSSSEDQDDLESLFRGNALSIFSSLEETIEKIDDFLLFEPRYQHGDIVCLVSNPIGQMGKVVNLDMSADLENTCGRKIQTINSKNLQKIRSISVGDFVVCGVWLGKVKKVVDSVTILFDDGTKSQLSSMGPEKIIALSPDLIEDTQYPFYPGQRVQVESSVSESTNWLCGNRRGKRDQGTVCHVDAGLVYIDWIDCVCINGEKQPAPLRLQDSKNLSLLSCFPHANWQLGDWCVLPDGQSLSKPRESVLVEGHKHSQTLSQSEVFSPNVQEIVVIVKTKTKVDVQWQDGSKTLGLDSHSLYPVNIIDVHDFWPDAFVLEKGTVDDLQASGSQRWGIVRCVDSKERTVKVKWCNSSANELLNQEKQTEEIVSAYELIEHPEYSYSVGEAVFRKDKFAVGHGDFSCLTNQTISKGCTGEEADLENGRDQTEYVSNNFLSHIGIVTGIKNGDIEVKWATGATSKVAPHEIYRADDREGTTSTSIHSEESVQHSIEDIEVKDNQLSGQKLKDVLGIDYVNAKDSCSHSLSQAAIGVFTSITSSLFQSLTTALVGTYSSTFADGQSLGKPPEEEALELCNLHGGVQMLEVNDSKMHETSSEQSKDANEDIALPCCSKHSEVFRQFDMVSGCSDHHFFEGSGMGLQSSQMKSGWLKKVHQEWSMLEKDLPETIYIRVYEDRINLLRAAVIGSAGTPYHDGLFFFDIYLPPQYPNEPPMVYYNSGGLRINPNLYESGKVCLSLLNTWSGSSTEVWNPGSSTILQVLLSLQALVLNKKPYFNEAGYDAQIGKAEGEKNSITYNENAFLVSCRSMLYLLHKPPKHFEGLVVEHFSRRCRDILSACMAYMEGAPIGNPFYCKETDQENQKGGSTGFKIMLGKLFPRLVEAFSGICIDCSKALDPGPIT